MTQENEKCCEKCSYSHHANEGHRGFVCECPCHTSSPVPQEKTYIFTREVERWGVEAGDNYNPDRHAIVGGTEKLLADGVIEEQVIADPVPPSVWEATLKSICDKHGLSTNARDDLYREFGIQIAHSRSQAVQAEREKNEKMASAAEMLWVVLANVSGGDWSKQSKEWQEAAARWRDNYFAVLSSLKGQPDETKK